MASHDERVENIRKAFSEANNQLISQVDKLSDEAATKKPSRDFQNK